MRKKTPAFQKLTATSVNSADHNRAINGFMSDNLGSFYRATKYRGKAYKVSCK